MKSARNTGTLRVVLDTNVVVSALHFPDGVLSALWRALLDRRYRLILSPALVDEIAPILRERFQWREAKLQNTLRMLVKKADIVRPTTLPDAVPDDPDDNHILACAVEGNAALIVSGDRHLLTLKEYEGIPIVRPVDFLRTLGSA
jgi:putative PIN family toxin of toxin-antitoxin system